MLTAEIYQTQSNIIQPRYGLVHGFVVLIVLSSNESSDKLVEMQRFTKAFSARINKVWTGIETLIKYKTTQLYLSAVYVSMGL